MSELGWLTRCHGFLLLDKPAGITSQDVITLMQRMLIARSGTPPTIKKRDLPRMGHGGTLDPFATGLLVIAIGNGTKLSRYLTDSAKTYEADVAFGARTASGDLTNDVIARTETLPASKAALDEAVKTFLGCEYIQLPPMYSAKKIDGTPLYELARKGLDVERASVKCRVNEFKILQSTPSEHGVSSAKIHAQVSAGTYIRTLAEDLAKRAASLAHLTTLRRIAAGPFNVAHAVTLKDLEVAQDWMTSPAFIPLDHCLRGKLPSVEISDEESQTIIHGLKVVIEKISPRLPVESPRVALYHRDELRAVFVKAENGWDFERVFHPASPTLIITH